MLAEHELTMLKYDQNKKNQETNLSPSSKLQ